MYVNIRIDRCTRDGDNLLCEVDRARSVRRFTFPALQLMVTDPRYKKTDGGKKEGWLNAKNLPNRFPRTHILIDLAKEIDKTEEVAHV